MSTTIAGYYTEELTDWNNCIKFYDEEIGEIEKKLAEVIRRNGIVDIAGKVEAKQKFLDIIADKFYKLQVAFREQEADLKTDHTFIDNSRLDIETELEQNDLRHRMQETEKEYIDIKFDCYHFLSGILKK